MSETKNPGEKLSVHPTKTLTLKRGVEQGVVRQSFSHGRTKQVVVEKVKRRVVGGDGKPETAAAPERAPSPAPPGPARPPGPAPPPPPRPPPPLRRRRRPRHPASCCAR